MAHKRNKPFPANPQVVTTRYRGPDRRGRGPDEQLDEGASGEVTFDAKGNPVWQIRVDMPRRRKDDHTIDMLKRLELDSLSLADESVPKGDTGYNPYNPLGGKPAKK